MKYKICIALLFILSCVLITKITRPVTVEAPAIEPIEKELSVEEILKEIPPKYGVDSEVVTAIAMCESTLNPDAIHYNDGGAGKHSVGILQFQRSTFDAYAQKMGEPMDYYSPLDQTKVASYMISRNQIHQWSCSRILNLS